MTRSWSFGNKLSKASGLARRVVPGHRRAHASQYSGPPRVGSGRGPRRRPNLARGGGWPIRSIGLAARRSNSHNCRPSGTLLCLPKVACRHTSKHTPRLRSSGTTKNNDLLKSPMRTSTSCSSMVVDGPGQPIPNNHKPALTFAAHQVVAHVDGHHDMGMPAEPGVHRGSANTGPRERIGVTLAVLRRRRRGSCG